MEKLETLKVVDVDSSEIEEILALVYEARAESAYLHIELRRIEKEPEAPHA